MLRKEVINNVCSYKKRVNEKDIKLDSLIDETIKEYITLMDDLKLTEAVSKVMDLLSSANKYIEESTPWALSKDESKKEELEIVMNNLARSIFVSTMLLKPVLIESNEKVFNFLGINNVEFSDVYNKEFLNNNKLNQTEILYQRLDLNTELEYIKEHIKSV